MSPRCFTARARRRQRLPAVLALVVLSACGGGGSPTSSTGGAVPPPTPAPTPTPAIVLAGQWERYDSTFPELDGMVVQVDGGESQGIIVSTPGNRFLFEAGDLKWRSITRTAAGEYRFDDLVRQANSGSQSYIAGVMQVAGQGQELLATFPSSSTVQRWRRK